jgi:hypothetical protein
MTLYDGHNNMVTGVCIQLEMRSRRRVQGHSGVFKAHNLPGERECVRLQKFMLQTDVQAHSVSREYFGSELLLRFKLQTERPPAQSVRGSGLTQL